MDCFSVVHPIENQTIAQNSPIYLRHQLRRITGIMGFLGGFSGKAVHFAQLSGLVVFGLFLVEIDPDAHGDWAANAVLGGGVAQADGLFGIFVPAAQGGRAPAIEIDRIRHVEL